MRTTTVMRMFRQTPRMMAPVPKVDQVGHTISQRLRKLKNIPLEVYPLFVVVIFAVSAAAYSCIRKFVVDKDLRLSRQGPAMRSERYEHHKED